MVLAERLTIIKNFSLFLLLGYDVLTCFLNWLVQGVLASKVFDFKLVINMIFNKPFWVFVKCFAKLMQRLIVLSTLRCHPLQLRLRVIVLIFWCSLTLKINKLFGLQHTRWWVRLVPLFVMRVVHLKGCDTLKDVAVVCFLNLSHALAVDIW